MSRLETGVAPAFSNPWANDRKLLELYRRRCRREAEEMTCAAQAAEILAPLLRPGDKVLDAGCGGGYYHWSFAKRNLSCEYHGLDYTPAMVELARTEMSGVPPENFLLGSIEYLDRPFDHVLAFNVLTNSPHYAQPLEQLLKNARRSIVIRESMGDALEIRYTPDLHLDDEQRGKIFVYHNTYPMSEVKAFMESFGFHVTRIQDKRTNDGTEIVCDLPHQWRILLGVKGPGLK